MSTISREYIEEKLREKLTKVKEAVEKLKGGVTFSEIKDKVRSMEPLWVKKREVYEVTISDGDIFTIYVEEGVVKVGSYYTIGLDGERDSVEMYAQEAKVLYDFFFSDKGQN